MAIAKTYPLPNFYRDVASENRLSSQLFETDQTVAEVRQFVERHIEDDFGHGMAHAVKVALEAGALVLVEGRHAGVSEDTSHRLVKLAHCAGLFHDIKRKQKDHAAEGAKHARSSLPAFALSNEEVEDIALAIGNHEAFKDPLLLARPGGLILSNSLYDADKFRWGPDNFTQTLWQMVLFYNPPLSKFVAHYWKGMDGVARIKDTFRTETGKKYGPQFIETGLRIGEDIFHMIKQEYAMYL